MDTSEDVRLQFQALLKCMTEQDPVRDDTVYERIMGACEDMKHMISRGGDVEVLSSSPLWAQSLTDVCVEYCSQSLDDSSMSGGSIRVRIVMAVYDVMILCTRRLPLEWRLDEMYGCVVGLLQMHTVLVTKNKDTGQKSLGDLWRSFIVDELVEILPCMESACSDIGGDPRLPALFHEVVIQGHLTLASESNHEMIEINSLSKVKSMYQIVLNNPLLQYEAGRIAILCAEHHHDTAVKLFGGLVGKIKTATTNAKCLHHCTEALLYGEAAMKIRDAIDECKVEIGFLVSHTRVLKAACLMHDAQVQEASKELLMMPDWSKEDDPMYLDLYFDVCLLDMRACALTHNLEKTAHSLRKLVDFLTVPRLIKSKQMATTLGDAMAEIIQTFDGTLDMKTSSEFVDAVLFLLQTSSGSCTGVAALMHMIETLPTTQQDKTSFRMPLLFDILTNSTVCSLIRSQNEMNQNICWDSFKSMVIQRWLQEDVASCIKFSQALLHYGPQTKKEFVHVILFSLYLYDKNYVMAEYCRKQLGSSMKEHPFVMGTMLLEQLETIDVDHSSDIEMENRIVMDMVECPGKWAPESVQAIRGIGNMYAREKLQCIGLESEFNTFQKLVKACTDGSQCTDVLVTIMRDTGQFFNNLKYPKHRRDMLTSIQALLSYLEQPSAEDGKSIVKLFEASLGFVKAARSIEESDSAVVRILNHCEFSIRILQCNEYLNRFTEIEHGLLITAFQECEDQVPGDLKSQQAISMVGLRFSLITGKDIVSYTSIDIYSLENLLGDDTFLEFIAVHVAHPKISGNTLPKAVLDHLSSKQSGLDSLFLTLLHRMDDDCLFRTYAKVIQSIDLPGSVGSKFFLRASQKMCSKMCIMMPWLFSQSISDTIGVDRKDVDPSIMYQTDEEYSMSESQPESFEVDSPPVKKQAIEDAGDFVSSLIKDLAGDECGVAGCETVGSSAEARTGIWSKWIKKVLG